MGIKDPVLLWLLEKQVYRLMKAGKYSGKQGCNRGRHTQERSKWIHQSLEDNVEYIKNIMLPMLSDAFVVIPKIREIPKGFTERIEEEIKHIRTAHKRVQEDDFRTVDPATCSALVLPDFCYVTDLSTNTCISCTTSDAFPTISVEIKPKKGFIPLSALNSDSSTVKAGVCKFCMHQRLKAKEGRWTKTSHYCPLDLFSGNRARMRHALHSLCVTPQNNLKICQNGIESYSEFSKGDLGKILQQFFGESVNGLKNGLRKQLEVQTFVDLIIDALLYVPKRSESHRSSQSVLKASNRQAKDSPCLPRKKPTSPVLSQHCLNSSFKANLNTGLEPSSLPRNCVLDRILHVQMLDQMDIEEIHPLYVRIKEYVSTHIEESSHWNLYGPFTSDTWLTPCLEDPQGHMDKDGIEYAVSQVKRHNVSKTAQDCSIMVAMQQISPNMTIENEDMVLTDSCGRKYQFSVVIIDLDPKPVDKIKKYHRQQSDIVLAFTEDQIDITADQWVINN
ncbi:inositol-pentakisphosphate 2-kinase-like isoform X2 [Ostrea edulis]|uniref:inositol-pentakisphosphate 2-kinase-like isoform X2 n=1 Tax=Ostrea edulis TaxID=37623 RepID=UPI0024AF3FCC|nr:inositol-pentakisphosphate 2-kinase-like isoform X2 [Ostrea edulis]